MGGQWDGGCYLGFDEFWCYGVDCDVFCGQVGCQCLGDVDYFGFGGGVVGLVVVVGDVGD